MKRPRVVDALADRLAEVEADKLSITLVEVEVERLVHALGDS